MVPRHLRHIAIAIGVMIFTWELYFFSKVHSISFSSALSMTSALRVSGFGVETAGANLERYSGNWRSRPLVMVSNGCSGSTFAIAFARKLVLRHTGLDPVVSLAYDESSEFLKHANNKLYNRELAKTNEALADKNMVIDSYKEISKNASQIMAPKLLAPHLTDGVVKGLKELNPRLVLMYRRNVLERIICDIRDCFLPETKHKSVFENGTQSDSCFERREHTEVKTLALVHKEKFEKVVSHDMRYWGCEEALKRPSLKLRLDTAMGFDNSKENYPRVEKEHLEAFQYVPQDSEEFKRSVDEWKTLLRSWDIEPLEQIILDEMRIKGIDKRKHKSVMKNVYNKDEVETLFQYWAKDADYCDWRWMMNERQEKV